MKKTLVKYIFDYFIFYILKTKFFYFFEKKNKMKRKNTDISELEDSVNKFASENPKLIGVLKSFIEDEKTPSLLEQKEKEKEEKEKKKNKCKHCEKNGFKSVRHHESKCPKNEEWQQKKKKRKLEKESSKKESEKEEKKEKEKEILTKKEDVYNQLCVLQGDDWGQFETFLKDQEGLRMKFLETFETLPGNGGSGGRKDTLFYMHKEDVGRFAIIRIKLNMFGIFVKWYEDAVDNGGNEIYPQYILKKYPSRWSNDL